MEQDADSPADAGVTPERQQRPAAAGLLHAGAGFIGNAGITLIGAAVGALLAMGSEVLAARFLGVAGYGLYALALMVCRVSSAITVFGVPISILHYLPVQLSRGERAQALGTVLGAFPLSLALSLALAIGLAFGAEWVAAHVLGQAGAASFLAVLGFAIPLLAANELLGHIGRGFGRALPAVVIQNIAPPLCSVAVLVSLLLSRGPQIGAAYGQVVGQSVGVCLGAWFIVRLVRDGIGRIRPAFQLGRLYGYALPITLNVAASLTIGFTNLFLLGVLTDAATVGTYRGCMQIVLVFGLPMSALAAATAPVYTVLIAEGQQASLQHSYNAAVRLATLLAMPLLLITAVNGADILAIMGPAFAAGAPALLILACGQSVETAFSPAGVILGMSGRQRLDAGNMALAAGLNVVLNLVLIPVYGLLGAALATTASLIALTALRCFQVRRALALHTLDRTLARIVLVTVPAALLIWAGSLLLGLGPGSGFAPLILRLAAMTVLIGGGLWQFCINAHDRAMVLRLARWRGAARMAGVANG